MMHLPHYVRAGMHASDEAARRFIIGDKSEAAHVRGPNGDPEADADY
jgi:hypothetical protein